ncbi:MAG: hypothetical protein U0361_22060 [Nitrospiraceae bacterium]
MQNHFHQLQERLTHSAMAHVSFLSILAFSMVALDAVAAPGTFIAQEIRTAAVNSNGERHDTESKKAIPLQEGQLFEQASFVTRVVSHKDDDEHRCTAVFEDYVEYAPGIYEPRKAFLYSFVKSKGGIVNVGKRGHLQCAVDYRTHDDVKDSKASGVLRNDATSVIVMLPADLSLERENRSLINLSVPLQTLQFSIDQAISEQDGMNLPAGFKLEIKGSQFRSFSSGSPSFHYYVDLDISGPIGARCEITARFAIPAAHPEALLIQDIGTTADCRSGSIIGNWFNVAQKLSEAIRGAVTNTLGKRLFADGSNLSDWAKDDPELATVIRKALIQGRYCLWRGQPGLCIAIGWRHKREINDWESLLFQKVPVGQGSIDRPRAEKMLRSFIADAIANHQAEANGVRYPSGFNEDRTIEDGDMAIFGGLLCRSGVEEGCNLIRNTNTMDGRYWRSPRRKNEPDSKDHASFSGDQLKGILHYLTVSNDRSSLEKFLSYLRSKPTQVPDKSVPLESGYSSCPNYWPNFTCLLSGSDWYALKLLARKHGLHESLPSDMADLETRYGFSYDTLVWEALMTNSGYRLHLVANSVWIFRSLGETDSRLETAVQIMAARQPSNPFFLYLLLGADRVVQNITNTKCVLPSTHKNFSDWAWQRAESDRAWERSMVWDCVFMYSLLTRDPIPARRSPNTN